MLQPPLYAYSSAAALTPFDFHSAVANVAPILTHQISSTSSVVKIPAELFTNEKYVLAQPKVQLSLAKQTYDNKYTKPLSEPKLTFAKKPFPINGILANFQSVEPFNSDQFKTVTQLTPTKNEIQYPISTKSSFSNLIHDLINYDFKNKQIIKPTYMPDFSITKPYKKNDKQKPNKIDKINFLSATNAPEIVVRSSLVTNNEKPLTAFDYKKFVFKQPSLSTITNSDLYNNRDIKLLSNNNNSVSIMIDNDPLDMILQPSNTESKILSKQTTSNNKKKSDLFKTLESFVNSNIIQEADDENDTNELDSHDQISSWVDLNFFDNISPKKKNKTLTKEHLELEKSQLENDIKKLNKNEFFIDEILNENLNQTLTSLSESLSSILAWPVANALTHIEKPSNIITTAIDLNSNKNLSDNIKKIIQINHTNLNEENNITQLDNLIDIIGLNNADQFTTTTVQQLIANNQEINNNINNNNQQQINIQEDLINENKTTNKKDAEIKKIIINNNIPTVSYITKKKMELFVQ